MPDTQNYNLEKDEPATDRKKDIIIKSTILFFEHGYDNTSTRELAIATGLSNAGIYYYFKDKEDILFHILDSSVTYLLKTVESVNQENNEPEDVLKQIISKLIEVVIENKMEIGLLIKESERLSADQLKIINEKRRITLELIKQEVTRLKVKGKLKQLNITNVAFSIIAITNWPFYWYDPEGTLSINELAEELTELFFRGVLKKENHT